MPEMGVGNGCGKWVWKMGRATFNWAISPMVETAVLCGKCRGTAAVTVTVARATLMESSMEQSLRGGGGGVTEKRKRERERVKFFSIASGTC